MAFTRLKNLFRKLPYDSMDSSFWILLDDAEKCEVFQVNGKRLNLTKALKNQYREPVLDYLLAEAAFVIQDFDGALNLINHFDSHIISRDGRYWQVSYEYDNVVEVLATEYCDLRGLIYATFEDNSEEAKEMLTKAVLLKTGAKNPSLGNREVYSFRPISTYALDDLRNNTITVASPLKMNDPFDSPFFDIQAKRINHIKRIFRKYCHGNMSNYERMVRGLDIIQNTVNMGYRIRCFVEDKPNEQINPLNRANMWGVYADSAKGMCVKYSLSSKFQNYNDGKERRYLHTVSYVDSFQINLEKLVTMEEAFFTKNKCWKYENEVRLLSFNPQSDDPYLSIPLDEDSYITDVYFGINCSHEDKDKVIDALGYSTVNFHSIEKDLDNYYVPVQLQHILYYEPSNDLLELFGSNDDQ